VPGLNNQLAQPIDAFLAKMEPGTAWLRSNWGLSRSPQLNQHPARNLRKLDASVSLDEVWLRSENQALASLPVNRGILFGIRIAVYPLADVRRDGATAGRLLVRSEPCLSRWRVRSADARESILVSLESGRSASARRRRPVKASARCGRSERGLRLMSGP
jgi:hypothetical protein